MTDIQPSEAEKKRARRLHAILLFNLVVNHIFLFLMALTLIKLSNIPLILMAALSLALLGYILIIGTKWAKGAAMELGCFRKHLLLAMP